jgi:hypothetical protein
MLDTVQPSQYFKIPAFAAPRAPARSKLATLRELQEEAQAERDEQARLFERLLADTVASDAKSDDLREIASQVREKELADESRLRPSIEKIQTTLAGEGGHLSKETALLLGAVLLICLSWLSLHRDVREGLLSLAGERQPKPKDTLGAKSVKGKIDWAEFSREHIARYPKIRARLAE